MSRIFSRQPRQESAEPPSAGAADFSHLSIGLGRFSPAEIAGDRDLVRRRCVRASHWLAGARASADSGRSPLRSSTCILLDDYPTQDHPGHDADPATVFGTLLAVTQETGLPVDYVARTAGLAVAASGTGDDAAVALVAARLVSEPPPGANGAGRPPLRESGWLCNGRRSPDPFATQAMQTRSWEPAMEFAATSHSVFLDVEVWRDKVRDEVFGGPEPPARPSLGAEPGRLWSPAVLAASWLLLRLGQLHGIANRAIDPVPHAAAARWPRDWDEVPTVVKVNSEASPLTAYRALTIAPRSDLSLEHAVRLILDAFAADRDAAARVAAQAADEGLALEPEISDRLGVILHPLES